MTKALLELKNDSKTPNTIRFLQFSPRSALVGYHQSVSEEIRKGYCQKTGNGIIDTGEPFRTSGCEGYDGQVACNRPYANSRPGPHMRNYPFPPEEEDIRRIRHQMKMESP